MRPPSSGVRLFPPLQDPKGNPPLHGILQPLPLLLVPTLIRMAIRFEIAIILVVDLQLAYIYIYVNSPCIITVPLILPFFTLLTPPLHSLVKDILLSYISRTPPFNTKRRGEESGEQT